MGIITGAANGSSIDAPSIQVNLAITQNEPSSTARGVNPVEPLIEDGKMEEASDSESEDEAAFSANLTTTEMRKQQSLKFQALLEPDSFIPFIISIWVLAVANSCQVVQTSRGNH
jgi:hypothetical protein